MAQEINGNWEILGLINAVTSSIAGTTHAWRPEWNDANDKVWCKFMYGNAHLGPVNFMCVSTMAKLEPDLEKWAKMALDN